ncbi:putative ribonuclease H-like domain-containing protein [Tanacetum coccineum]|uniref:Ribonuclease H-like domain-containing protein n=1 Tax=Tanacetum coccineum TaxID=301880 RepID=A0ABQ5HRV1_9ASTR
MLHELIVGLEKQTIGHKVKTIRCDHGTEFKNQLMNEFCAKKGIKREYSIARTPQQNGVAERKNRTLIEAARTMLADSLLPIQFWAEAVNTACYSVRKENYAASGGNVSTHDDVEDLDDQQFIVHGPSIHAAQPMHSEERTADKEVSLSSEEQALHDELVNLMHQESLAKLHNDAQRTAFEEEKKRIALAKEKECANSTFTLSTAKTPPQSTDGAPDYNNMDHTIDVSSTPTLRIHKFHPQSQIIGKSTDGVLTRRKLKESDSVHHQALLSFIYKQNRTNHKDHWQEVIGTKWVFRNKRDEWGKEVFYPISRTYKGIVEKYCQTENDTNKFKGGYVAFGNDSKGGRISGKGTIKTSCLDFEKVSYVEELKFNLLSVSQICDKKHNPGSEEYNSLGKDEEGEDVDVHLYRSMIGCLMYLTASRPDIMFVVCLCARFQVTPKVSHLHAVKRIFRYLKHQPNLGLWYPKDSPFHLEAFSDSDYAGDNHDRRSTSGGCQYLGRRLVSWQCKKQTIVAISSTEAEYVAAASCCAQVLWMQNQLLDYGFNFMNTEIHIDNESTICIVRNPVLHSKTKHIQIRHHFIRDCYEQRLINVVKVHTDDNVADLLTKGFDLARFNFLVKQLCDLLFDDANGVDCFPKQVIWDSLRDIGYEDALVIRVPHGSNLLQTIAFCHSRISNESKFNIFFDDTEWIVGRFPMVHLFLCILVASSARDDRGTPSQSADHASISQAQGHATMVTVQIRTASGHAHAFWVERLNLRSNETKNRSTREESKKAMKQVGVKKNGFGGQNQSMLGQVLFPRTLIFEDEVRPRGLSIPGSILTLTSIKSSTRKRKATISEDQTIQEDHVRTETVLRLGIILGLLILKSVPQESESIEGISGITELQVIDSPGSVDDLEWIDLESILSFTGGIIYFRAFDTFMGMILIILDRQDFILKLVVYDFWKNQEDWEINDAFGCWKHGMEVEMRMRQLITLDTICSFCGKLKMLASPEQTRIKVHHGVITLFLVPMKWTSPRVNGYLGNGS